MANDPTAYTYYTTHLVQHDGTQYPTGSEFKSGDPKVIEALRRAGAIALRQELERPEQIASQMADLQAQNAALLKELEELRAAGLNAAIAAPAAPTPAKTGKATAPAPADESK